MLTSLEKEMGPWGVKATPHPHLEVCKTLWEREEPSDLLLPPWPLEVAWPLSRNLFQVLQNGLGGGREALWPSGWGLPDKVGFELVTIKEHINNQN